MREQSAKNIRRAQRKLITTLISNFTFWDRVKFIFTGNYYKPLQRSYNHLNDLKQTRKYAHRANRTIKTN